MSKFFNLPVVGIDVSADYSMVAVLAPNGTVYRKTFKVTHDADSFSYLLKGIRKVKNDKKDALTIANIAKYQNIKMSDYLDINIFSIRSLCRDYYSLVDNRSEFKKKLSSDLRTFFPGYNDVFSDAAGVTSLAILTK